MSFRVEHIERIAGQADDRRAEPVDDFDEETWISPYLRRPLRSLDEVLAQRRACEHRAKMAKAFEARSKSTVVEFADNRKYAGQVA